MPKPVLIPYLIHLVCLQVYKALKGGVQVVAVKKLSHINERVQDAFVKVSTARKGGWVYWYVELACNS